MSRKGENIYKRKDQRWEGRYIRGHHPDGTIHYGYCYGKTYKEVKQKLSLARELKHAEKESLSFGTCCDQWLVINRDRVKKSTYVKYSTIVNKHVKPGLGKRPMGEVTSAAVEQFSHELLYRKGLSAKTVRDILTVVRSVVKFSVRQHPEEIAMIDIVYPKDIKNEPRVLTREEQKTFVSYLLRDMDRGRFGVLLTLLTGMRVGEVCALRWGDISLDERSIRIGATMQRLQDMNGGTSVIISEPKSNSSVRTIPLTDYAAALCEQFRCSDPEAFILTGSAEQYTEPRTMQYRFQRYTRECGLEGVHFHTLRHTFATRCVEVDFEIKTLSEILGHSSPRITLERYVHPSMTLKRENMKKLEAIGF